jgi:hypothetical protein
MLADDRLTCAPEITNLIVYMRTSPDFETYGGAQTLIADLLTTFLCTGRCAHPRRYVYAHSATGTYDGRARALLKHMSALLALSWDTVLIVENSLTHLLVEESFVEST